MFYVYVLFIPVLILAIDYGIAKPKPRKVSEYISLLLKAMPHEFGYAFLLYYLDNEKNIDTGWSFLTLIMFFIPITVIVLLLKLFYWLKASRNK
jgi:hypothetical protein